MEIGWSTKNSLPITSHSAGQSRATLCNEKHTHTHTTHTRIIVLKEKNSQTIKTRSVRSYSLPGVSLEQGVVGKQEAAVGAQQDAVSYAGHRIRLGWLPVMMRAR